MDLLNSILSWLVVGIYANFVLTLVGGAYLMAQIDDLKALLVEVAADQSRQGTALVDLADDVDKLLAALPTLDLTDAIAQTTAIRDQARALADASEAAAAKFPVPPTE